MGRAIERSDVAQIIFCPAALMWRVPVFSSWAHLVINTWYAGERLMRHKGRVPGTVCVVLSDMFKVNTRC